MKKKIFLLGLVVGAFLLLAGCKPCVTESALEITDKATGAGTKTITFSIPQDAETVIEVKERDDGTTYNDYTIYNNSSYFPKGYDGFMDWFMTQLPDKGYTYTIDNTDASNILIHFSYSFTSYADYADKTRALMGEERWTDGKFVEPQLYVTKVEDPEDSHFGKLKVTFAESHYMITACVNTMLEIGISEAAVEAGVFVPFGDCCENSDCKNKYKDSGDTRSWKDYCIEQYMVTPDNVCDDESGPRTYTFEGDTYVENQGKDGLYEFYVEDDGTWTVTEAKPTNLGVKGTNAQNAVELDENGEPILDKDGKEINVFVKYFPESNNSWIVIVVIVAVVAVAAVVVIAIVIKKKNDEYEDDDEDEDEDEDEEEDEEE